MDKPLNCWEFNLCGREPGGAKAGELGICPAASESSLDGIHRGDNSGRACWAVAGTLSNNPASCGCVEKFGNCGNCDFFRQVVSEEGKELQENDDLLLILSAVAR